ncbi:MAG TPA: ADP-ribose pyrophosphatase, partial [Streptosporangiaceae bacterium]
MDDTAGLIYQQLSTRVAYESPYLRLHEDGIRRPDGSSGVYSYVVKPDFALVIPVEDGGFHLVEQYRYPVRERSWEFPQGTFPGLDPTEDV